MTRPAPDLTGMTVRRHVEGTQQEVDDVIGATIAIVNQMRDRQKLADTVTVTVTVPYNPPMRPLFEAAAPALAQAFIGLDWSLWERWSLERSLIGEDWEADPFIQPVRGEYRISCGRLIMTVSRHVGLTPEQARIAAARLLEAADLAELRQAKALEGGASR